MPADPMIDTIMIDGVSYYLPSTKEEVVFLVSKAQKEKKIVCLRGAAHSRPLIRSLESESADGRLYIFLAKMMSVSFNDKLMQVTVEGGCHLGFDPSDPLANAPDQFAPYRSTVENSLVYQLDHHRTDPQKPLDGWAMPDLGGIIHQTVGGFLSTGSSGSNLEASFNEQLISIELVTGGTDGARIQSFSKEDPNYPDKNENPFYAVGVGLGLCGVIVSATFQCITNFNIVGQESTVLEKDCPINLFDDRPDLTSLVQFFTEHRYKRIMWWPQNGVQKTVIWQAEAIKNQAGFVANPYKEVPDIKIFGIETPLPAEIAAHLMMSGFAEMDLFLKNIKVSHPLIYDFLEPMRDKLVPFLLNLFVPVDPVKNGKPVPPAFQDIWYGSIPMDNKISDVLIPVWFTELWFPIQEGPEVLNKLRKFFHDNPDKTGNFSYEIYPAKASEFWLSAAYHTDVFRIDMFWYGDNPGSPTSSFYPAFWNLLSDLNFRPHWGKYLPPVPGPDREKFWKNKYPNFDKFMAVREELDPQQVFVSNYWRGYLFNS